MKQHKAFWNIYSQREVTDSEFLQMAKELKGKSEEEQITLLDKYAKKIETNPKRENPLREK